MSDMVHWLVSIQYHVGHFGKMDLVLWVEAPCCKVEYVNQKWGVESVIWSM